MISGLRSVRHRAFRLVLAALALAGLAAVPATADVLTYHGAPNRSGLYVTPSLTWLTAPKIKRDVQFAPTFTGAVDAQPLYWQPPGGSTAELIVATEADTVYALNATTGAQIWHATLGTPVPLASLPCGNIDPTGVTGTPVIDPVAQILYLDALVLVDGLPRHQVFGLSLATGKAAPGWPIDVATGLNALGKSFDLAPQGQHSALTLIDGRLYVPFAGRYGDCGSYHGWAVGFETAKPGLFGAWSARAPGGGSWGQSGIAYDGTSMFLTTGNSFTYQVGSQPPPVWDDGEAVIRLMPSLANTAATKNYFAPANWVVMNEEDLDLGGTSAIPVDVPSAGGKSLPRILALGKDGNAYLLDRSNLGGIGGALAVQQVASASIISAMATYPAKNAAMVAFTVARGNGALCNSGQISSLVMLSVTASAVTPQWCAGLNGSGAPIVTTSDGKNNPIVWVVSAQGDQELHGFSGADGSPLYVGDTALAGTHHYGTLLATSHRLYIGADQTVYAFKF